MDNESTETQTETPLNQELLASRWKRLLASLIDALTILAITVPLMYFTSGFSAVSGGIEPSFVYTLFIGVIGLSFFFFINRKLLFYHGQTIGKMVLGIKIVDLNGQVPSVKENLLPRYATYLIPGYIPVIGQFFSIINILFIFSADRRCLHDHIGKTRVVACKRIENEASINT